MATNFKKWDPCCDATPSPESGTNYQDNPGLKPGKDIPSTPGEKATNDAAGLSYNKPQPFGQGGSGYSGKK